MRATTLVRRRYRRRVYRPVGKPLHAPAAVLLYGGARQPRRALQGHTAQARPLVGLSGACSGEPALWQARLTSRMSLRRLFRGYARGRHLRHGLQCLRRYDVAVCAKTGTAQHGSGGSDNASFVLYAPADDPEIAIAVYVEKGAQGGTLGTIARDILTAYFSEAAPRIPSPPKIP